MTSPQNEFVHLSHIFMSLHYKSLLLTEAAFDQNTVIYVFYFNIF